MASYTAFIEFEGSKFYSRAPSGCESINVKTYVTKSENFEKCYESAKASFISPFTGENVSLELGLANHGKSKSIKRIIRTINSYLDSEESRIREKRYNSMQPKTF